MARGFEHLRGHKYCLLVTYKRSGEPVPTPVWFGLGDGKLYVRSEAGVAKVRRIRNDPRVRVAPCTVRGKPLGPPPTVGHGCSRTPATRRRQRPRCGPTTDSGAGSMKGLAPPSGPRPS